jgi:hypothetical protein
MNSKRRVVALFFALGLLLYPGCSTPQPPLPEPLQPSPLPVTEVMSVEQARDIAEQSSCMDEGPLTGDGFYNENSRTWWFDLDVEKEGCNPACVVNVVDKTTEVNWRCTGALPPEEDADDGIKGEPALIPDPAIARDAALAYLKHWIWRCIRHLGWTGCKQTSQKMV